MGSAGPTGDALINVIRDRYDPAADVDRAMSGIDEDALVRLVETHRIAGLLCAILGDSDVLSSSTLERLTELKREAWARNIRAGRTAAAVKAALDPAVDGEWVILKGPALADWYGAPNHRGYIDLDLFVSRQRFGAAMDALAAAGFPEMTGNWQGFLDYGVAEVPMGSHEMVLDLHWHPIALARTRRHFDLDVDAMIDRRRCFVTAGEEFPTFDAEDTLLHLCLHGGLAGLRRLVWMIDIDVVVRSGSIDWGRFTERADAARAATMAAVVLDRTRRLLGTPVEPSVIGRLCRVPGWTKVSEWSERPRSDARRAAGWYSGMIPTVTRDSIGAITRTIGQSIVEEIAVRRGASPLADDGGDIAWNGPDSGDLGRQRWIDYAQSTEV